VVLQTTVPGITVLVTASDGEPVQGVAAEYRSGSGACRASAARAAPVLRTCRSRPAAYDVRAKLYGVSSTVAGVEVGVGTLVYVSTVPLTAQILTWSGSPDPKRHHVGESGRPGHAGSRSTRRGRPARRRRCCRRVRRGNDLPQTSPRSNRASRSFAPTTVTFSDRAAHRAGAEQYGQRVPGVTVEVTPDTEPSLVAQVTRSDGTVRNRMCCRGPTASSLSTSSNRGRRCTP